MVCSICGLGGHNKRTCSQTFSLAVVVQEEVVLDEVEESPHLLSEMVAVVWEKWSVMSGDPMEMNLVTESEEVDISTEGFSWGDLPLDAVNLILDLVEKYNTDYHEDRVRMTGFSELLDGMPTIDERRSPGSLGGGDGLRIFVSRRTFQGVKTVLCERVALEVSGNSEAAENWQATGRELRRVVDALDDHHRALTPKAMKYKYLAEHTKYHNPAGRKRCAYNGWYSWYHTLEQRENSIQNEYWQRRSH